MDTKESEKQNPVEYVDETDSKQSKDAKQENVAFRIHAVPNEYSGFFDFSQEAYVDHKVTKKIKYAQDLDIEPFEQRIGYIKEEKPRRKAPLIAFIVILCLLISGAFAWRSQVVRDKVTDIYEQISSRISNTTIVDREAEAMSPERVSE